MNERFRTFFGIPQPRKPDREYVTLGRWGVGLLVAFHLVMVARALW